MFTVRMITPSPSNIQPMTRLSVLGFALFAIFAASKANTRVNKTQAHNEIQSGAPLIIKWLTDPVNAVNVIMKTLVPTAHFNS